ncbi:MAG TPA: YjcZ family sporulation protein [Nitrososphaeraceae archaeon]|jgi:uncharacterized protein (TIGR01732 family)|nr:YjcZ family sporulation protein [Nitrososphaeraceae archaeon]
MKDSVVIPVTVVLVVAAMLITAAPVTSTNIVSASGYKKSQGTSQANSCGNGSFLFNVMCQNLESEVQGDGNAINIIALQKGGGSEFDEWLSGMDEQQLLSAFEWLKTNGFDKEWLQNIDQQEFLSAFEWLRANGFDKELLGGSSDMGGSGYGSAFVLILVLFILLVIIGASFGFSGG